MANVTGGRSEFNTESVRLKHARMINTLDASDGKAFASLFAPDGVMLATGRPAVARDDMAEYILGTAEGRSIHALINDLEIVGDGGAVQATVPFLLYPKDSGTAWARGIIESSLVNDGAEQQFSRVNFRIRWASAEYLAQGRCGVEDDS